MSMDPVIRAVWSRRSRLGPYSVTSETAGYGIEAPESPCSEPHEIQAAAEAASTPIGADSGRAGTKRPRQGLARVSAVAGRALVADDTRTNTELLQDLLEDFEWEVEVAEDGAIAMEKMAVRRFDLLLLDLHMPNGDGIDVLRRLRRGESPRPGHVVLVTADPLYGIREQLLGLGADALLAKPIDIEALKGILAEAAPAAAG